MSKNNASKFNVPKLEPAFRRRNPLTALLLPLLLPLLLALLLWATPALADWQSGVDAFQQGDYAAAEQAFRQLAEERPDWYGGHFMLGRVLAEQDRTAEALQSLGRAYEAEARPEVALLLARTALGAGQSDTAQRVLAEGPDDAWPTEVRVAWLSLRAQAAGDAASKLADLKTAVALAPQDAGLRLSLGDAALEAGRSGEAVEQFAVAAEDRPGDEAVLVRLAKARLALAEAATESEQPALCARAAESAAELAGLTEKAGHLSVAGRAYRCAGDLVRAEEFFARADAESATWRTGFELAKTRLELQQWQQAEEAVRPWLEQRVEGREKIHQLMGRALEGQQRFAEAIPHYEIAGDQEGIAHAREGQAALRHNEQAEQRRREIEKLEEEMNELEEAEEGLR